MTNLCRALLFLGFFGTLLGVLRNQGATTTMALGLLAWIFFYAAWYHLNLWWYWKHVKIRRTVADRELSHSSIVTFDSSEFSGTLWEGRSTDIAVWVTSRSPPPGETRIDDLISPKLVAKSGSDPMTVFAGGDSIELLYCLTPIAAGKATFFGVRFVFRDSFGLFESVRTKRELFRFEVLPQYDRKEETRPIIKRVNALPRQGIHSVQRSGFGSELLELRSYQPGDPPKSIAWKVSARRDMLMTRQYESEVPVRIQIFLEGAGELRQGSYGSRPIDWLSRLAASVTHAAIKVGDPVTTTLIDQANVIYQEDIVGDRGFYQTLRHLSTFTDHQVAHPASHSETLDSESIELALWLIRQWAPDWFDLRFNPATSSWFPVTTKKKSLKRGQRTLLLVFAEVFQLPTAVWMRMESDYGLFNAYLARFLQRFEFPRPYARPSSSQSTTLPRGGRYVRLSNEIRKRVAKAKDNQVFVIGSTALTPSANDWKRALDEISPAIRLAVAKHHRVSIVAVRTNRQNLEARTSHDASRTEERGRIDSAIRNAQKLKVDDLVGWAEGVGQKRKERLMEREVRRLGASFVIAESPTVVRHLMNEAELAGRGRTNRRGAR